MKRIYVAAIVAASLSLPLLSQARATMAHPTRAQVRAELMRIILTRPRTWHWSMSPIALLLARPLTGLMVPLLQADPSQVFAVFASIWSRTNNRIALISIADSNSGLVNSSAALAQSF
jgi:hypothetical protein